MWYFWKQNQFCSSQKDFSTGDGKCPPLSTHTYQFTLRGIMFSTGKGDKTAHIIQAFCLGLSWANRTTLTHVICHQHKSHFPGYCLTSIKETSFVFKAVLPIQNMFLFQNNSHPLLDIIHQTTEGSACPQHGLLRKENDHQKSVYALTALALKPTSWTRNRYCADFQTPFSLITGTRFIPSSSR